MIGGRTAGDHASGARPRVGAIGHLQMDVLDPRASIRFYTDVLGFEEYYLDFPYRVFLRAGEDILTLVRAAPPISTRGFHLGFLTESEEEMDRWRGWLEESGVAIERESRDEGGSSVYIRDPDGYLIEFLHVRDPRGRAGAGAT
jgi:catechol 2,3-dioxygenase-like lactoylglutathione lyase family enzyme